MNYQLKSFDELSGKEVYEILKSRNEVFVLEQQCIYQDCDHKDTNAYHLFVEDNGEIIAYLRILKKGIAYNEVSIGRVLVKKEYRRRGLARQIMLKAIEFIENELNEKSIRISAQQYLIDFYDSLGFKVVSDVYLEDSLPHQEMLYEK